MGWLPPHEQLAALRQLVRVRGGELLSKAYVNGRTKVEVQCLHGHAWLVTPVKLRQGRWCPVCHYDRLRMYATQRRKDRKAGRSKASGPMLV
jgi:hypothetical protein